MVYTAYTEEEYKDLSEYYRRQTNGVSEKGEVLQVPRCPECGGGMMEVDSEFLSCIDCAAIRRKRIIKV